MFPASAKLLKPCKCSKAAAADKWSWGSAAERVILDSRLSSHPPTNQTDRVANIVVFSFENFSLSSLPPTYPPIKRTEWQIYRWLVFSFEYWGKYRDHSPIPSQCNHSLSIYSSHYLTKSEFDRHSFSRCLIDLFNVGLELYCFLLLYPLRWEFVGIFFSLWHHYNLPRPSPTPPFPPSLPVFESILTCICVI